MLSGAKHLLFLAEDKQKQIFPLRPGRHDRTFFQQPAREKGEPG